MKIKYIHRASPEIEKIHDTERAFRNSPSAFRTQGEYDDFVLQCFDRDIENGIILSYEVVEER